MYVRISTATMTTIHNSNGCRVPDTRVGVTATMFCRTAPFDINTWRTSHIMLQIWASLTSWRAQKDAFVNHTTPASSLLMHLVRISISSHLLPTLHFSQKNMFIIFPVPPMRCVWRTGINFYSQRVVDSYLKSIRGCSLYPQRAFIKESRVSEQKLLCVPRSD